MISDRVKLVGPSVNCENAGEADPFEGLWPAGGDGNDHHSGGDGASLSASGAGQRGSGPPAGGVWTPHVQSYAVATDAAGLRRLLKASGAFRCHAGRLEAIRAAEVGASAALLAEGFNLGAFQLKYSNNISWGDAAAWKCNGRQNPTSGAESYDGGALPPLEAMFVKVKAARGQAPAAPLARAYARWRREEADAAAARDVSGNDVFLMAEEMGQRYMQRVLGALHGVGALGSGDGDPAEGGGGAQSAEGGGLLALVKEPPDDGHGLPPDMAALYAAYVGQFM